jgi:hypothetical protein
MSSGCVTKDIALVTDSLARLAPTALWTTAYPWRTIGFGPAQKGEARVGTRIVTTVAQVLERKRFWPVCTFETGS